LEVFEMSQVIQDVKMEQLLGNLLRGGVLLAAAVVLTGGSVYLIHYGMEPADHRVFRGEPGELRGPAGIVTDSLTGDSRSVIQLGLLLLIATPVARVAFSVVAFAREHDIQYVVFTLIVLTLLLCGLFLWRP
jgi:uncharacterized membrane protein